MVSSRSGRVTNCILSNALSAKILKRALGKPSSPTNSDREAAKSALARIAGHLTLFLFQFNRRAARFKLRASSRDVLMMEPGAAPAGLRETYPQASRAAPGLRSGALRPPARSWLTAGRPKARPGAGKNAGGGAPRGARVPMRNAARCYGRAFRRSAPSCSEGARLVPAKAGRD